jgi:glycosyltransferase involved in cell wall biosynthesis
MLVKPKNILFIIPEMSMGGAQRSLSKLSNELGHFYNVSIVVFNKAHTLNVKNADSILSLDVYSGNGFLLKSIAFFERVRRLRKLKRELSIDIAISFLEGADYVNILSRLKEKVIVSIRGSKVYDENMLRYGFYWRRKLIRLLYKKADAIVCVNNGIAREMAEYYRINLPIHVIYNFYDVEQISEQASFPVDTKLMSFFQGRVVAMSGRLAIEKGHLFVISIFSALKKSYPDLRLILIGDGPCRQSLLDYCSSLNITVNYETCLEGTPDVFITGETKNVFSYLGRATLYILNSSSEGFPNGLAEAMACGLPVMSSDCPYGPREILSSTGYHSTNQNAEFAEFGVLLPMAGTGDSIILRHEWVSSIRTMLESPQLRDKYKKAGLKRILQFSKTTIIDQWRSVIG